jgi:hypothetical protein
MLSAKAGDKMSVLVTLIVGDLAHDNPGKQVSLLTVPRVGDIKINRPGFPRDVYGVVRRVIHNAEEEGNDPEVCVIATVEDHF